MIVGRIRENAFGSVLVGRNMDAVVMSRDFGRRARGENAVSRGEEVYEIHCRTGSDLYISNREEVTLGIPRTSRHEPCIADCADQ